MADSWLMKLCVDRDITVANSWLHENVCRQKHELWLTVGYMKLCLDRELISVGELVS